MEEYVVMPGWAFLFWDGTTTQRITDKDKTVVMPGWAFLFWDLFAVFAVLFVVVVGRNARLGIFVLGPKLSSL